MILKPSKIKVGNFFMYYGWLVIILSVLSFALSTVILSAINRIKANEKFSIFIAAYGIKEERNKKELLEYLKEDKVIEVNYYSYFKNELNIGDYFSAYGFNAEINILSEKELTDMDVGIKNMYIPFDNVIKTALSLNEKYQGYEYESDVYAIKLFDKDDESYNMNFKYQEWINFTFDGQEKENYYLLLNKNAPTYGEYSKRNIADYALKGVKYFLDENEK